MCDECGGVDGWLVVLKQDWKDTKQHLQRCGVCKNYAFCSYCARTNPDLKYVSHGDESKNIPETFNDENTYLVKRVKISWCGP